MPSAIFDEIRTGTLGNISNINEIDAYNIFQYVTRQSTNSIKEFDLWLIDFCLN